MLYRRIESASPKIRKRRLRTARATQDYETLRYIDDDQVPLYIKERGSRGDRATPQHTSAREDPPGAPPALEPSLRRRPRKNGRTGLGRAFVRSWNTDPLDQRYSYCVYSPSCPPRSREHERRRRRRASMRARARARCTVYIIYCCAASLRQPAGRHSQPNFLAREFSVRASFSVFLLSATRFTVVAIFRLSRHLSRAESENVLAERAPRRFPQRVRIIEFKHLVYIISVYTRS